MIAIVNMGGGDPDPMGWRTYEVRINHDLITTFFDGFTTNSSTNYAFYATAAPVDYVTLQNGVYYEANLRGHPEYFTNYTETNVVAG